MKWIIFGILLTIIFGANFIFKRNDMNQNSNTLRVAFPGRKNTNEYEPTKIYTANEYILLENIYSPLVELSDNKGTPVSSIAENFKWEGNELHFKIRDNLETIDGYNITAKDAAFSLKRLLILSGNTHGNFKDLVCWDNNLKSPEEECPGIGVKENTLILKTKKKNAFLLPMLAAIDFAIIPQKSVDPKTLKIIDYRNTSGAYYVEGDKGKGNITLRANRNHFHYSFLMPEIIQLVPTTPDGKSAINLFKEKKVDHITTISGLLSNHILEILETENINSHETLKIRNKFIYATKKGMEELSLEERLSFAKIAKEVARKYYMTIKGYEVTDQYFPVSSESALNKDEEKRLIEIYATKAKNINGKGISFSMSKFVEFNTITETLKQAMPELEFKEPLSLINKNDVSKEKISHFSFATTDTSFQEDIGLISYNMNIGRFGLTKKEGEAWLKDYMETDNKEERLTKLRKLHFNALASGKLIPLVSSPYIAVVRKAWKLHFSELFANNQLWKIRKN